MNNPPFYNWPSLRFLDTRGKNFFSRLGLPVVIPSAFNFEWNSLTNKRPTDVLLFGDALQLLTHPHLWPRTGNFRFWVLSERHARLAENIFGLPRRHIGVVPRTALLAEPAQRGWPGADDAWTLVMASRLQSCKNFELSLTIASRLQQKTSGRAKTLICYPEGRHNETSLNQLIKKQTWQHAPLVRGDLGTGWHRKIRATHPVLIELSTYLMEDFGVSVGQARARGWPLIVSAWGAFHDIAGRSTLKLPAAPIFEFQAASEKMKFQIADRLTDTILKSFTRRSVEPDSPRTELKIPIAISAQDFNRLAKRWDSKRRRNLQCALGFGEDAKIAPKISAELRRWMS